MGLSFFEPPFFRRWECMARPSYTPRIEMDFHRDQVSLPRVSGQAASLNGCRFAHLPFTPLHVRLRTRLFINPRFLLPLWIRGWPSCVFCTRSSLSLPAHFCPFRRSGNVFALSSVPTLLFSGATVSVPSLTGFSPPLLFYLSGPRRGPVALTRLFVGGVFFFFWFSPPATMAWTFYFPKPSPHSAVPGPPSSLVGRCGSPPTPPVWGVVGVGPSSQDWTVTY